MLKGKFDFNPKKTAKMLITSTLIVGLAGCSTMDPYTGESKTSKATTGAAVGAVAGAVIGAATSSKSDRKKGVLTGAVAGGAIGAGVGYYMDKQEAALRERLTGTGVQVVREGDNLRLVMPGNITFASSSANVRSDFLPILESVSLVLKEFKDTNIRVAGHTDSTGSLDFNQLLSEQRATSVKLALLDFGVEAGRVAAVGYGPRYPVASNDTAAGRQENRRVELTLEPTAEN